MDSAVQVYRREVGAVPRLTRPREAQLIERIRRGGEDAELARRDLVEANLQRVVFIARRHTRDPLLLLDLIQHGNNGLMKAANEFDYSRGARFSAHAVRYIREAIAQALAAN